MPSMSAAGIAAGGSLLGGAIQAGGSLLASGQQQKALQSGIQTQITEQNILAGLLDPYFNVGIAGSNQLLSPQGIGGAAGGGALTQPFQPTMAQLEQTPGYQFTLNQGLQGVANAYSGQGLGNGVVTGSGATTPSGPGVKGALNYAEGLAASTYQQQFQNYLAQNSQIYNMMMGGTQLGEQATSAWGGVAQNMSNTISGLQSGVGAAQAQGTMGVSNALSSGISQGANALANYGILNSLGAGSSGFTDAQFAQGFNAIDNGTATG